MTKKVLLQFPSELVDRPILYEFVKEYDLLVNIFRAKIDPDDSGFEVLELTGDEAKINAALEYARGVGINVNEKMTGLIWEKDICTSCGTCLPHCPTNALYVLDRKTMEVSFDDSKCVECLSCIEHCPYKACTSIFKN